MEVANQEHQFTAMFISRSRGTCLIETEISFIPVEGTWTTWGAWTSCSINTRCGGTYGSRFRDKDFGGGTLPCSARPRETSQCRGEMKAYVLYCMQPRSKITYDPLQVSNTKQQVGRSLQMDGQMPIWTMKIVLTLYQPLARPSPSNFTPSISRAVATGLQGAMRVQHFLYLSFEFSAIKRTLW